jgi:hypothetical protein
VADDAAPNHTTMATFRNKCVNKYLDFQLANRDKVTDYLLKKGYTRTEAEFRKEISKVDTSVKSPDPEENKLPEKYLQAIKELEKWVETSLDIYKVNFPTHQIEMYSSPCHSSR